MKEEGSTRRQTMQLVGISDVLPPRPAAYKALFFFRKKRVKSKNVGEQRFRAGDEQSKEGATS
jgi:hypothetical protein